MTSETIVITVRLGAVEGVVSLRCTAEADGSQQLPELMQRLGTADAEFRYRQHVREKSIEYCISRDLLDRYTETHALTRVAAFPTPVEVSSPALEHLTQLFLPTLQGSATVSAAFLDHFVMLLCACIVQSLPAQPRMEHPHRGGLSAWQKRLAKTLLTENLQTNIKLSFLSRRCGLSASHFARAFKASFGQPVHRWTLSQRVERAKALMQNTSEPLIDIAARCGFSDQASFNRTFARLAGTSPGRWRKLYKLA